MTRRKQTRLDAIVERLHHSRNPYEQMATYLGLTHHQGIPVLHDNTLQLENIHIVGSPGSGKTSRAIQSIALQRIAAGQGAVVIIDGKGDMGLFHSIKEAAFRKNRRFKFFTNRTDLPGYGFNPWDPRLIRHLTLVDILGLITNALNVYHGDDYGRAWFSVTARILLARAIRERVPGAADRRVFSPGGYKGLFPNHGPIQSFYDLYDTMRALSNDSDEFKAAQHLVFIVETLCDFPQLNIAPKFQPGDPEFDNAIFMPDVVENKEVVYFFLAGGLDLASVAMIAKLALYMLSISAQRYKDQYGDAPRVDCICDEAQVLIAKNIANVLEQARSRGIASTFAHQSMSQLNPPGGQDLRELMMQCSATKMLFDARDPWTQDYLVATSGQTKYFRTRYDVAIGDLMRGNVGLQYVAPDLDGRRVAAVSEYIAPRLNVQDILNVSFNPDLCLTWIARAAGLCAFQGWFPMRTEWPHGKLVADRHQSTPWPAKTGEMIFPPSLWGDEPEIYVPQKALLESKQRTEEVFRQIWEEEKS